ncbi:hypothetical protein GDO78_016569 [Eleutherodactylus coqui]|uniref:Uncharacterized protein n=1 Tax=Eleutherodactylus coqui TaxID=57060 RepID=A0A8J6BRF4_ELECQ|nr:hypothetical protein GDO78_016569 [Eleutherodactylus coqui]
MCDMDIPRKQWPTFHMAGRASQFSLTGSLHQLVYKLFRLELRIGSYLPHTLSWPHVRRIRTHTLGLDILIWYLALSGVMVFHQIGRIIF